MTGYKKIFMDTAPFIYYIEKNDDNPMYFNKVKGFLMECYRDNIQFFTSVITIEEYLVAPYKKDELFYIEAFERMLKALDFNVVNIDKGIAEKAAMIRAKYRSFKPMDALQLATACITGCDLFLTNDKQLRQFREVKCITLDDLG